jgi:hypothetical protein
MVHYIMHVAFQRHGIAPGHADGATRRMESTQGDVVVWEDYSDQAETIFDALIKRRLYV